MHIAYLDCFSGISGDMMLGALVDAGPLERLNEAIGSLGLPGCRLIAEEVKKLGMRATQVTVQYQPEHAHRHLGDILAMIHAGRLSARQRELAERIFTRLAEAEAKVHGIAVEKVHFHEVGPPTRSPTWWARPWAGTCWASAGAGLGGADRDRPDPHRPRRLQRPRAGHGGAAAGNSLGRDGDSARADHAHGRGHPGHPG